MPYVGEKYGSPLDIIHRGDLQKTILEGAQVAGIDIKLNHKVIHVDNSFAPRVQVSSGEWLKADVITAAVGIKSHIREQIASSHGVKDRSQPTGDAAYRILIPKEKLNHDPKALALLNEDIGMR
jgi:salicylate hydroxylase